MYRIKTATLNDVEEIWSIIEKTLESEFEDDAERRKQLDFFYLTHSIKKIELEIMNNYQHYILLFRSNVAEAFAAFSILGRYPSYLKIQKIFHHNHNEKDAEALIDYMEDLSKKRGLNRMTIQLISEERRFFFESKGFEKKIFERDAPSAVNGLEMIKRI